MVPRQRRLYYMRRDQPSTTLQNAPPPRTPASRDGSTAGYRSALAVEVRPWSDRTLLDPGRRATVPVAVRQTEAFDPTDEPARYRFGAPAAVEAGYGTRPVVGGVAVDLDDERDDLDDGRDDLVLFFPTDGTGFRGDESEAMLAWDGDPGDHDPGDGDPGNDDSGDSDPGDALVGTDSVTIAKRYRWQRSTRSVASR